MTNTNNFNDSRFANNIDTTGNLTDLQCFDMFCVDMTLAPASPNTLGLRSAMKESDVRDKNRMLWNIKPTAKPVAKAIEKAEKADRLAAHAIRINANKELIAAGREDDADEPIMLDTLVDLMGKMDLDI